MTPRLSKFDCAYVRMSYSVRKSYFLLRSIVGSNSQYFLRTQHGKVNFFASPYGSVGQHVRHIVLVSCVREVFGLIVGFATVFVTHFHPFRAWTVKSTRNNRVQRRGGALTVSVQVRAFVASGMRSRFKNFASYGASYPAHRRHFVPVFPFWNGLPIFTHRSHSF